MKYLILLLSFSFFLHACEQEHIFDGYMPDPRLVLYSFIQPDSIIEVQVYKTRLLGQTKEAYRASGIEGELYINGQEAAKLRCSEPNSNRYTTGVSPRPGDRIRLVVRADDVPEASAEITLPRRAPDIRVDTFTHYASSSYNNRFHMKIHLREREAASKYYRLVVKTHTLSTITNHTLGKIRQQEYAGYTFDKSEEPLLNEKSNNPFDDLEFNEDRNIYNLFTNKVFQGKEYTLHISANAWSSSTYQVHYIRDNQDASVVEATQYHIQVLEIDEATYLYFKSEEQAYEGEGILADPIKVYSNVKNGVGIVGGYYQTIIPIQLPILTLENREETYSPFVFLAAPEKD